MVRMKVTLRFGEGGVPTRGTLRSHTPSQEEMRQEGEAVGGTGGSREAAEVITHPAADSDGGRGGTLNDQYRGWPH